MYHKEEFHSFLQNRKRPTCYYLPQKLSYHVDPYVLLRAYFYLHDIALSALSRTFPGEQDCLQCWKLYSAKKICASKNRFPHSVDLFHTQLSCHLTFEYRLGRAAWAFKWRRETSDFAKYFTALVYSDLG